MLQLVSISAYDSLVVTTEEAPKILRDIMCITLMLLAVAICFSKLAICLPNRNLQVPMSPWFVQLTCCQH